MEMFLNTQYVINTHIKLNVNVLLRISTNTELVTGTCDVLVLTRGSDVTTHTAGCGCRNRQQRIGNCGLKG